MPACLPSFLPPSFIHPFIPQVLRAQAQCWALGMLKQSPEINSCPLGADSAVGEADPTKTEHPPPPTPHPLQVELRGNER